ncbi:MAG: DUF1428 domain-containing protein [Phycisphaerae bacterium]|nr:DUF1428 domain-containing protein [Phycisphaerae bacterium]
MPKYVDGYVIPIPTRNLPAYRKMASVACKVWIEHGALEYHECVGEDLKVPFGMTFPKGMKLKKGDTVVFAWVVYKSRAHRDRVNAKVMKDPRLGALMSAGAMPFDAKRMMFGGFKSFVDG